jgi:hypothetical protein
MKPNGQMIKKITQALTDEGKLIEAGWVGLKMLSIPENAPAIQVSEMRNAFFCGAQHLFASIMTVLEPDADPTDADLKRMDLIDKELKEFIRVYKQEHEL